MVVAMSGGIDSSCLRRAGGARAGADRVFGLLLPERDSSGFSARSVGRMLAEHLGIRHELHDIAPALEAIGCYASRDAAIRAACSRVRRQAGRTRSSSPAASRAGDQPFQARGAGRGRARGAPAAQEYLQIVAATNFKQRIRKTLEYFHADRLNYAVVGTPNRLEYDQGFFVKNGDGAADVKPIAHLYKTQVYALARHLGLPEEICARRPPPTPTACRRARTSSTSRCRTRRWTSRCGR
jgi:NAD+ synthase